MSVSRIESHFGPWTEADYFALPEDNRRIELLDGSLLLNPSPSASHQRLSSRLWLALERARPVGMEVLIPIDLRVGAGRILIPDLTVVRHTGRDFKVLDAADAALVIEIVSLGSVAADRAIKPRLYAEAGIPCYVRIEPEPAGPTAIVGHLAGERYVFEPADSVLRLREPFRVEIDLVALLEVDRLA